MLLTSLADAPVEFLEDLACDLIPEVAVALVRNGALGTAQAAGLAATLASPEDHFAALAAGADPADVEELWRIARAHPAPRARLGCLGALLGTAPERHAEVLASLPVLKEADRIWALARAFPHLSADLQRSSLDLAAALPNFRVGASSLAPPVRPEAFRHAWELFQRVLPAEVAPRARLVGAAPADERAALVDELVPLVRAGARLGHGSIRELLPHAAEPSRRALIQQAFLFGGSYAASTVARVLGTALRAPEVEERYVMLLDLGLRDYQWDRAVAYAAVARQRGPGEEHCRLRATALLDLLLGQVPASTTPIEPLQFPVAVNHRLNTLMAVTLALEGEERDRRERQVLELLERAGPELSVEDMVPIAWERAAHLHPRFDERLLALVDAIREDRTAFEALVTIAAAEPRLATSAFERLRERLARRWASRAARPMEL